MNSRLMCTVSDDKTVRIFDTETHKQIRAVKLDTKASCCSYSSDGHLILVGLGSGNEEDPERKEGAYVVLSEEDLTIVYEARDSKLALLACRYSPIGDLYALTSMDGMIYIYKTGDFSIKAICKGHTGCVSHIDFSQDGRFIMSNSTAGEIMFWDSSSGEPQIPKMVKELKWSTNTCIYSYATQGFYGPYDDKVELMSACRSNGRDLIAMADNCGRLRIGNAPCVKDDPTYFNLTGHAAIVKSCEFACDDSHLYSIGGSDGTILQWRVSLDGAALSVATKGEVMSDDLAVELLFHGKVLDKNRNTENVLNDIPVALCQLEEGLVEVDGLKPWQKMIIAPSLVPIEDSSEPSDSLELEFIYGFTTDHSRQSLMYTSESELLFFAGSVAVLMEQQKRKQRFYSHHHASISAMTASANGSLIASGDVAEAPTIRIWNSMTLETLAVLQGFHRRGICHLKFASNNKHLASVGLDRMHSWAVYDWQNNHI
eukprot:CAMPEP_0119041114 /NCGR_PEP_ID=MMETSP1177-20130426/11280_1 /TAXON_ID=2985 /ORGANISM="Ochromonas sp, Strain CCMP1899" /LENGTH=484 /DNA_ID=CAMNT_0007006885 /DNA_START=700 /DNA_END=2151 /DNA_ORIENTATION=-